VIRVRDNPGVWWLLALLFMGVGVLIVAAGVRHALEIDWWQAPLAVLMGAGAVGTGVWWAWRSPLSIVAISPAEQQVRLVQIGLFGRRVKTVPFPRIEDVVVERQSDTEGGAVVRPALLLRDGTRIPLSALWRHDVKRITRNVATLRSAIRRSPFAGLESTEATEAAEATEIKEEGPPF
jgi:hypothetical protein